MRINFDIDTWYAISYRGRHIDLHNNFHFTHLEYNVQEMSLTLKWARGVGNWIKDNELSSLTMVHRQVSYFKVIPRDPEMPLTEDNCLESITAFPSDWRDEDGSLSDECTLSDDNSDIIYKFQSDQIIRVACDEIELTIAE